jgi:hypothetical protein
MFALLLATVGSSLMNFTHILIGNWTVNATRLTPNGAKELVPEQVSIRIRSGLLPSSLDGDILVEDADGVLVVTQHLRISRAASDNTTFSMSVANVDAPDAFDSLTDVNFTALGDGLMTATGSARDVGSYAITVLSPTIAEVTLLTAETKEVTIYRLLKDPVRPPSKGFLSGLGPMLIPLAISMILQRFLRRGQAAQPHQEAPKDKTD